MNESIDGHLNEHNVSTIVVVNFLVVVDQISVKKCLKGKGLFLIHDVRVQSIPSGKYSDKSVSLRVHTSGHEGLKRDESLYLPGFPVFLI